MGVGDIVRQTNYHLSMRLHSLAVRILVSTRAHVSQLTEKSELSVLHVANVAVVIFWSAGVSTLCERCGLRFLLLVSQSIL